MPVSLKGAIALRKALRQFEPDLAKETTKEIALALKPIVKKSRSLLPSNDLMLSNWTRASVKGKFPRYDYTQAKRGITYKATPSKANNRGFRSLASIFNKTAAGAIYETAGRKKPDSTFVKNLMAKTGASLSGRGKMAGRVIFRVWEEDNGKTQDAVIRAIENSAIKFKERTPNV